MTPSILLRTIFPLRGRSGHRDLKPYCLLARGGVALYHSLGFSCINISLAVSTWWQ